MVQDLYVLMITAAVVSIVFKLLKQPVVLGYIVAGVLVGPHLFGKSLVNPDNVKQWGDIGVLFVLFCIGLEFRLKNLISRQGAPCRPSYLHHEASCRTVYQEHECS